jgi:hypothetical protein
MKFALNNTVFKWAKGIIYGSVSNIIEKLDERDYRIELKKDKRY